MRPSRHEPLDEGSQLSVIERSMGKGSGTVPSNALAIKALQGGLALARRARGWLGRTVKEASSHPGGCLACRLRRPPSSTWPQPKGPCGIGARCALLTGGNARKRWLAIASQCPQVCAKGDSRPRRTAGARHCRVDVSTFCKEVRICVA